MARNTAMDVLELEQVLPGHLGVGVPKTPPPQTRPFAESIGAQGHSTSNTLFRPCLASTGTVPKQAVPHGLEPQHGRSPCVGPSPASAVTCWATLGTGPLALP